MILPITECNVSYENTNYRRYGIHYHDDHYLTFSNKDSLKLHYLNAVHDKMPVGKDGFIETSIKGPDVIFSKDHCPSTNIYEKYRSMRNEKRQLFELQNISCYARLTKKINMFSKHLAIEQKLNKTEILPISKKAICAYDGFAFPYLDDNIDKEDSVVTFALLHKDDASALIKKNKIRKDKYNVSLDKVAKCKVKIKIPKMSKCGISLEEVARNDPCKSSIETKDVSEMDYHCMWKRNNIQLGIWKVTSNIQINDLISFKKMLQKTYGNFGFKRAKSPCFDLNTYTGK